MLRIKKEYFNEEELKKYGFLLSPITKRYYTYKESKKHITINEYGDIRIISHTYKEQDLIYDLIIAGIVEKVQYERRKKKTKDQQKIDKAKEYIEELIPNAPDEQVLKNLMDILEG